MIRPGETIARFGPDRSLVGIFTVPPAARATGAAAIVIPNTGIGHRSSHHRLFVIFARALASAGYPVLRFDLSGLGDSVSRGPEVDRGKSDEADLRAALDWVEAAGHGDVILLGLCSGADRSIVYSSQDKRVRGVILIDPTVPPTIRYAITLLRRRLAEIARERIVALFRRPARRSDRQARDPLSPRAKRRGTGPAAWLAWYKLPGYLANAYASSIANDVAMLVIFTSGVQRRHSYEERLTDAFPRLDFRDQLSVRHLDGVHHLLVLERERQLAIDAMNEWLSLNRPPAAASVSNPPSRREQAQDPGRGASELVEQRMPRQPER